VETYFSFPKELQMAEAIGKEAFERIVKEGILMEERSAVF